MQENKTSNETLPVNRAILRALIRRALSEDIGAGDLTSQALVPPSRRVRATVLARSKSVVCGSTVAALVFQTLDAGLQVECLVPEGRLVAAGTTVMRIRGAARSILAAERTALNFIQRLAGIASLTARFARLVKPYGTIILDTRKTTPGWRALEKYAVRCGGGTNHRMGLYDRVLIKDTHRALRGERNLAQAVRTARRRWPDKLVQVEVESLAELQDVLTARPDWIMLDNMCPDMLRRCVRIVRGRCPLEASGGITLANARAVAATGVEAISLGCLTHSAPAADFSLEIAVSTDCCHEA